jgi:hypothetical protein
VPRDGRSLELVPKVAAIFAAVPTILYTITSAADVARVADVFTSVTAILSEIATILSPIKAIFDPIAPLVAKGLAKGRRAEQRRDEQCGKNNLRESHHHWLPWQALTVRREDPLVSCPEQQAVGSRR